MTLNSNAVNVSFLLSATSRRQFCQSDGHSKVPTLWRPQPSQVTVRSCVGARTRGWMFAAMQMCTHIKPVVRNTSFWAFAFWFGTQQIWTNLQFSMHTKYVFITASSSPLPALRLQSLTDGQCLVTALWLDNCCSWEGLREPWITEAPMNLFVENTTHTQKTHTGQGLLSAQRQQAGCSKSD